MVIEHFGRKNNDNKKIKAIKMSYRTTKPLYNSPYFQLCM